MTDCDFSHIDLGHVHDEKHEVSLSVDWSAGRPVGWYLNPFDCRQEMFWTGTGWTTRRNSGGDELPLGFPVEPSRRDVSPRAELFHYGRLLKPFPSRLRTGSVPTNSGHLSEQQPMNLPASITPSNGLEVGRSVLARLGVTQPEELGPVMVGRELLIQASNVVERHGPSQDARAAVIAACGAFMAAVAEPDEREYGLSSREFAVADALLWFGIASGALVSTSDRVRQLDGRPDEIAVQSASDPTVLNLAGEIFARINDGVKAARCLEEMEEIFQLDVPGDPARGSHFKVAAKIFEQAGRHDRVAGVLHRLNGGARLHSEFLTRRAYGAEAATTVAGSVEYQSLRSAVRH